ncbi:MAG: hypothetical protein EPN34_11980 [Burkholderiaceae bacterium]|nr:MAG: hypothetical protein EPN34_11980 [Burkholderiaceae bacterium]
MTEPSPAIVAEESVHHRLPRWALILVCLAYVLPGYLGRDPWKNADIAAFGTMLELQSAHAWTAWLHPTLMGMVPESTALLPYWLGALTLRIAPAGIAPDLAVRLPFLLMLIGTFATTWYAVKNLASHASAQPVAFAFGGEAEGRDYARALADGGLLALIATLGLAQLSHETTPDVAQLFFTALTFCGLSALGFARPRAATAWLLAAGLVGLSLGGAPASALVYGIGASLAAIGAAVKGDRRPRAAWTAALVAAATLACGLLLGLGIVTPNWHLEPWRTTTAQWQALGQLFLWFTWPCWAFVLWTLWRWRRQLLHLQRQPHLGIPIFIASVPVANATLTLAGDRALLLALPALAALAAFALPTFKRAAAALIDSFSVLFFSICAIAIWVVWISVQTGFPAKPAANVARLAPDFVSIFQWPALVAALGGTIAWVALAQWRTARHRPALWKSLVLPAGGTTLCWLLLATLWMPALNYSRSYAPQMAAIKAVIGQAPCVEVQGLLQSQIAAIMYHGGWQPIPITGPATCPWLLASRHAFEDLPTAQQTDHWRLVKEVPRPSHKTETLFVYERIPAS